MIDGNPSMFRRLLMAVAVWMLGHGVEGKRGGSSWSTLSPTTPDPTTTTTPSPTMSGSNLLCDADTLTTIKGEWTADSSECTMENTDSRCGNVVWIGSDDGATFDGDYDCDCFEMTVVLEIDSGGDNAGVMFRTGECAETNNAGPSYYVGLSPGDNEVVFTAMDDGSTELHASVDSLCYGKEYILSIRGCGNTYSVYVDGELVMDVTSTDFSSGSIGLRTYKAPSTFHHLSFECDTTTSTTPSPTTPSPTTAEPTPKPTKWPTAKPTASPSADPTASPTTPSPTQPGELICGDRVTGDFIGDSAMVTVRAPFDCAMTVDLCDSDFEIGSISAFNSNDAELSDSDSTTCSMTITAEHGGDYTFFIEGASGESSGTFDLDIECSSDSPTRSPSAEPSDSPSSNPSAEPSNEPSPSPSANPSAEPSAKPTTTSPTTAEPSLGPTDDPTTTTTTTPSPTTPSPTTGQPTPRPTTTTTTTSTTSSPTTPEPTTTTSTTTPSPTTAEPTTDPTSYPTFPVCDTDDALNIAFLMDESGSVDSDEWDIITEFVDRIATYDVAGSSYVSLFEYASLPVYTQFLDWTAIEDGKDAITSALDRNPYTSTGKTFTWDAVNRVLDEFWSYRKNCTDGCETRHDILFLLTDGEPSDDVCPDMVERANTTSVDIVIIGIGTYAESTDNWMSQIDCLDVADDKEDIYYVTEFEAGDFNAIEGVIRNYTCDGEHPVTEGDRGGDPWVYDDGSTGLGPVPTTDGTGGGVQDDTPSPVAAAAAVSARTSPDHAVDAKSAHSDDEAASAWAPDKHKYPEDHFGGHMVRIPGSVIAAETAQDPVDVTFLSWLGEGAKFFTIPDQLSTTTVVLVALVIFVAVSVFRRYFKNKKKTKKSYKRVVFQDAIHMDSDSDIEAAQPMNK